MTLHCRSFVTLRQTCQLTSLTHDQRGLIFTSVCIKSFRINAGKQRRERERVRKRGIICFIQILETPNNAFNLHPICLPYLVEECWQPHWKMVKLGIQIAFKAHYSPSTVNPSLCSTASSMESYFRFRWIMCISRGYRMSFRTCSYRTGESWRMLDFRNMSENSRAGCHKCGKNGMAWWGRAEVMSLEGICWNLRLQAFAAF